jgi:glutathione S-transferase
MKLHFHPVSTASRPVLLFCAEAGIKYDPVVIDIMTGEHTKDPFTKLNPSGLIPVLEDGDFVLSESSAILKYLAE